MKYAFIESDLVVEFPLQVIWRVLRVTQAGYHAWLKRPASAMLVARDALAELIKRVFSSFKGKYGAPRIYRELCRQHGYTGSYERVRVLMQALGLKAKAGRKYKVTTDSAHALPIAPNLLGQDFTQTHASAPNQVWLSDITYLWTKEGWVFCGMHARSVHPGDCGLGDRLAHAKEPGARRAQDGGVPKRVQREAQSQRPHLSFEQWQSVRSGSANSDSDLSET